MIIQLGGQQKEVPEGITVSTLLELLTINPIIVAVEINGEMIPQEIHEKHILNKDDCVDILSFVGTDN
jgi:sulfur carrier protein